MPAERRAERPADRSGKTRGPVLALEASSVRPGAALLGPDGESWGCWQQAEADRGTAPLAVAAAQLLAARRLVAKDLLGVAVGTGPGSYTGTRAAIAFARGLVFAGGGRLAGVPSVAAAARGLFRRSLAAQTVIVIVDARRGEVYRADYARVQQTRIARSATRLADALVAAGLREIAPPRLVAGPEAAPAATENIFVIREPVPDPYDVAAVGRERLLLGGDDPAVVLPLYLKRSHAEIVFDERVGGAQGLG